MWHLSNYGEDELLTRITKYFRPQTISGTLYEAGIQSDILTEKNATSCNKNRNLKYTKVS